MGPGDHPTGETGTPDLSTTAAVDVLSGHHPALPGDRVDLRLTTTNGGSGPATDVVLLATPPAGLRLAPHPVERTGGGATTTLTDAAGDDPADHDTASRSVRVRLGAGAEDVGALSPGSTVEVTVRAVVEPVTRDRTVSLAAEVAYRDASGAVLRYAVPAATVRIGPAAAPSAPPPRGGAADGDAVRPAPGGEQRPVPSHGTPCPGPTPGRTAGHPPPARRLSAASKPRWPGHCGPRLAFYTMGLPGAGRSPASVAAPQPGAPSAVAAALAPSAVWTHTQVWPHMLDPLLTLRPLTTARPFPAAAMPRTGQGVRTTACCRRVAGSMSTR